MSESDDGRIRQAIAGDTKALSELLREFGPKLREQLSIDRRWQAVLDPDDVLQVTYLETFLKIHTFTPGGPGAFYGWLRRIAENNLRDAIKGLEAAKRPPPARSLQVTTPEQSVIDLLEHLNATSTTPSRVVAAGEMQTVMTRALAEMPDDYATVIREYDLNGRPMAEIAAQLKRSPGAIHMLRARAHDRLRELMGPDSDFFSTPA